MHNDPKDYRATLQKRLYMTIAYIVIGIAMVIVSYISNTDNLFLSGYGTALIACGLVRIRNHIIITRTPERIKQQEIAEKDERNMMLQQKAQSMAYVLYIIISSIILIILGLLDQQQYVQPLAYSICLLLVIYLLSYYYLHRRY